MDLNIKQKIVTDNKNTFFTANKFMTGSSIPTEGEYVKGDIIVNIGENAAEEPMWICVEAGNPGVWQLVGIASDDEDGESFEKLVSLKSRTVVTEEVSEVVIGITGFNKASDTLVVFINSVFATEGVDYTINDDSTKILPVGENWNKEFLDDFEFDFIVLKHVEQMSGTVAPGIWEVVHLKSHTVITEEVSEVEIGIPEFNNEVDDLTVYRNSTHMIEGVDYEVEGSKIVSLKGNWNLNNSETIFAFEVVKTVAKVNPDAVVGMDNLTEDVKQAIENASNVDLSDYASKADVGDKTQLQTTEKGDLVGAINELFQSANNGKELIASAIGEPLSSEDTFSAMSDDINSLLSTFKTNMMNNGITVESGDKFKALIDKIATMAEEGEGKGIQFVSGEYTLSSNFNGKGILTVDTNLNFSPEYFLVCISNVSLEEGFEDYYVLPDENILLSTDSLDIRFGMHYDDGLRLEDNTYTLSYNQNSFSITGINSQYVHTIIPSGAKIKWYAIGVGEEDTTLRDSLASILTEEGVSVTEEDDMASLITKVDEEFTNDNNTISEMETDAENTRSTLARLMQEGGYDITGDEDINNLLDLLVISGIKISDIKQIATGGFAQTFILKFDGSLWACGRNDYGQLGLGNTTNQSTFTPVTTNINNDVDYVACCDYCSFIIKKDGSLWACGIPMYGEMGFGDTNTKTTFTKVTTNIDNNVKEIYCGEYHVFVVKNNGSVWACGKNDKGQLGLGDTTDRTTFTQVTTNINNDVSQIACGGSHTIILKNDGTVWSCGYNAYGELGIGDTTQRTIFTQATNDVKQIACGSNYSFILKNDGTVWSCGYNYYGNLGIGTSGMSSNKSSFTQVTNNINNDVKQLICRGWSAFIIKNDGSLWACGNNGYGQLGLGDNSSRIIFTQVTTNINNDVKQVVCGNNHTFVLKDNDILGACGYNLNDQLGLSGVSGAATSSIQIFLFISRGFY